MKAPDLRAFLTDLYAAGQQHDAQEPDRTKKMLNLEPETAQLVYLLLCSSRRTRLLEVGTSNGYSTIWLAWVASLTGGRVTSIDRDPHKQVLADANLRQVGLREVVDLQCGDATEVVARLSGPFDGVFFDADRFSAPEQLAVLLPKLTTDVLLLADNVLSHPDEIAGYVQAVAALADFDRVIIPIGKGLSVAYRSAGSAGPLSVPG